MLFPSCQTVKIKWLDEIAFTFSFLLLTIVSKRELVERWGYSPASFQGWQLIFSFVIFVFLLIHPRIRNEVKILNRASLALVLPVSVTWAAALAAGANALANLPVPIVIAWLNVSPAVLALACRKSKSFVSPVTLGSVAACLSVVIIFVIDSTEGNRLFYLFLCIHVLVNIIQSFYLKKVNLQVTDFTILFYNLVIGLVALFPVSVYNATEAQPWALSRMLPCFFTGFLNLALQIFTFRVRAKGTRVSVVHGIAQFFTILNSLYVFDDALDPWVLCLVGANWFLTAFVLNYYEEASDKNDQFILVVPHVTRDLYVEKYINYGDMA